MIQRIVLVLLLGCLVNNIGERASSSEFVSHAAVTSGGTTQGGYGHWVSWTIGQCAIGTAHGSYHDHQAGFWHSYEAVVSDVDPPATEAPARFALVLRGANPSRGMTIVQLAIPERSPVSLGLYDVSGRFVRSLADGIYEPGYHDFTVRSDGLCAGIYFCRLNYRDVSQSKTLVLLR